MIVFVMRCIVCDGLFGGSLWGRMVAACRCGVSVRCGVVVLGACAGGGALMAKPSHILGDLSHPGW